MTLNETYAPATDTGQSSNSHTHTASMHANGNGTTDAAPDGHKHIIQGGQMSAGADGHTHDMGAMAKQDAADFGQDGMIEMIRGFRCLGNAGKPDYTQDEIAEAIYSGRGDCADLIRNALAWYALESVARELNPEI